MALTKTAIPYLTRVFGAARGCSLGCSYCSTARWSHRLACPKCRTREVHLHPERLGNPAAAKKPQVIGVSFYDELWDPLRPGLDIHAVLAACDAAPQHQYVFLTKRPERIDAETVKLFAARENWWLGVTEEGTHGNSYRLDKSVSWAKAGVKTWLSLEPWQTEEWSDNLGHAMTASAFVAVGCESGRQVDSDNEDWQHCVLEILGYCHDGPPVYVKQVWVDGLCSRDPAEWPEALRVQELPEAWERIIAASGKQQA